MVGTHGVPALFIVELVSLNDGNLLEGTLAVDLQNVRLTFFHELFANIGHVSLFGTVSNLDSDQGILRKDNFQEVLLGECDTLNILLSHIDELRFLVAAHIVVTNIGVSFALDSQLVLLLRYTLSHQVVTDSNNSFLDEIHIGDFMLLI